MNNGINSSAKPNIFPASHGVPLAQQSANNTESEEPKQTSLFQWFENTYGINSKYSSDSRPLINRMVDFKSILGLRYCLLRGANLNTADYPPLVKAVSRARVNHLRDFKIVNILVSYGADVNAEIKDHGGAPLHDSAYAGDLEICKFLISHGANVNIEDKHKTTPLHSATTCIDIRTREAQYDKVIELLLAHRANPNAADEYNRTPLFNIIDNAIENKVKENDIETFQFRKNVIFKIIKILLLNKAEIDVKETEHRLSDYFDISSPFILLYYFHVCKWACGEILNKDLFDCFIEGLNINQLREVKEYILKDINKPRHQKHYNHNKIIPIDKKPLYFSNLKILVAQIDETMDKLKNEFSYFENINGPRINLVKKIFPLPDELIKIIKKYDFNYVSLDKIKTIKKQEPPSAPLKSFQVDTRPLWRQIISKIYCAFVDIVLLVCMYFE